MPQPRVGNTVVQESAEAAVYKSRLRQLTHRCSVLINKAKSKFSKQELSMKTLMIQRPFANGILHRKVELKTT